MEIRGCVALVTGANRGIGKGFVLALRERGAQRIYATARKVESLAPLVALDPERIVALPLDITSDADIAAAAHRAADLTLLINNGGTAAMSGFLGPATLDGARREMEVNFWGQLAMIRAFSPVLKANKGGGIIQILSIGAFYCAPAVGSYCASKFAANAMCQGLRAELAPQNTRVMSVFSGAIESDMSARTPGPKISALTHGHNCLAAFEDGCEDCYPDFKSQRVHAEFLRDPRAFMQSVRAAYRPAAP